MLSQRPTEERMRGRGRLLSPPFCRVSEAEGDPDSHGNTPFVPPRRSAPEPFSRTQPRSSKPRRRRHRAGIAARSLCVVGGQSMPGGNHGPGGQGGGCTDRAAIWSRTPARMPITASRTPDSAGIAITQRAAAPPARKGDMMTSSPATHASRPWVFMGPFRPSEIGGDFPGGRGHFNSCLISEIRKSDQTISRRDIRRCHAGPRPELSAFSRSSSMRREKSSS